MKRRCLKWARMTHLDIWNTSYDQKKGRESNCQFDSRPLKVQNWPNFLACRRCATYHWKSFNKGYNFSSDFIIIGGLHMKLWAPKVAKVLVGNLRGQNAIWMWPPWRGVENTIRGKVVASPKSKLWWVLWVWNCPWFILAPKMLKLCTNQLVVWFVRIRVIE